MGKGRLTDQHREFVSYYVGQARMNASLAARLAGYSHRSATGLMQLPQVREEIDRVLDELRSENILNKRNRLEVLIDMADRALTIRDRRAAHYQRQLDRGMAVEPGAETGMLLRSPKVAPDGAGGSVVIDEWSYDRALAADLRSTLEHTARELGEWNEKHTVTGANGGPVEVATANSAEQKLLAAIAELADRAGTETPAAQADGGAESGADR